MIVMIVDVDWRGVTWDFVPPYIVVLVASVMLIAVIIWGSRLIAGIAVIIWDNRLIAGIAVIIWDNRLISGIAV